MATIIIKKISKRKYEIIGKQHSMNGNDVLYATKSSLTDAINFFNQEFKRLNWDYEVV